MAIFLRLNIEKWPCIFGSCTCGVALSWYTWPCLYLSIISVIVHMVSGSLRQCDLQFRALWMHNCSGDPHTCYERGRRPLLTPSIVGIFVVENVLCISASSTCIVDDIGGHFPCLDTEKWPCISVDRESCVIAIHMVMYHLWNISVMIHFVPETLGQCYLQCFALAAESMKIIA